MQTRPKAEFRGKTKELQPLATRKTRHTEWNHVGEQNTCIKQQGTIDVLRSANFHLLYLEPDRTIREWWGNQIHMVQMEKEDMYM